MKLKFKNEAVKWAFEAVYMDYYWDAIYELFLDNVHDIIKDKTIMEVKKVNNKNCMILNDNTEVYFCEIV